MIDFDEIKARHPIQDYLARRGFEAKRASGGYTARCPLHDGDNKASLFIHGAKQYAKCWTRCGYIGSVIRSGHGLRRGRECDRCSGDS